MEQGLSIVRPRFALATSTSAADTGATQQEVDQTVAESRREELAEIGRLLGGLWISDGDVEEVFQIQGIGWETLRAIEARDAAWIVAVTLLCAIVTTVCLVASDVAYGLLDPRVRESQTRRRIA